MGISGVYVIFGPGNRIYVGQSSNILNRTTTQQRQRAASVRRVQP